MADQADATVEAFEAAVVEAEADRGEEIVRDRIEAALRDRGAWQVESVRAPPVKQYEQALANRLLVLALTKAR